MKKIHRGQIELYALGADYIRKIREQFWQKPLKNIRKGELTGFEERIQEKFPNAWKQLQRLAQEPFDKDINRKANDAYFQDIFRQIKQETGVYQFDAFLYIAEGGKGLCDKYGPFVIEDNKYHLRKPYQDFFFPNFRRINTLAFNVGCRINWVVLPGKYGERPFKNNYDGVHGMYEPNAQPHIEKLLERAGNILNEVYGKKIGLIRGSNEVGHSDSDDGAKKKLQHEFFYECLRPVLPLGKWVSDVTFSDYIQLTEREFYCLIKCNEDGSEMKRLLAKSQYEAARKGQLELFGKIYSWVRTFRLVGNDEYDRLNWLKHNGFNYKKFDQPIETGAAETWMQIFKRMASKKIMVSTDGNVEGSGQEFAGGFWFNITYDEGCLFMEKCNELEAAGKNVIASDLPKEVFFVNKNNWVEEDWSLIDIPRMKFFQEKAPSK